MRRGWVDRIAGVLVGVAIGLGVLVYFVFVHSEGTIDAPKVNESGAAGAREATRTTASPQPSAEPSPSGSTEPKKPRREARPVPVVKVIGGAPPTSGGPKQLRFRVGEKVRFEIDTSEPFSFEIRGLGIEQTIEGSSIISFPAKRAGQFPVIATSTLIGVADLLIEKKKPKASR